MSKQEAIEAMLNGAKVTHIYFMDDEYIYMDSGLIYFEDGTLSEYFWQTRSNYGWQINWSIYRGESE